jgi:ketosteroid isomerase-like protein
VHQNEEVVRRAYDAFARRDMPALLEMMSDEITFMISGKSIQSGTFAGKEEVRKYFSIVGTHTAGTHRVEVLEVLVNDGGAIALVRALGQRGEHSLDMTVVHIWRVSDGKLARLWLIAMDQYAFDAFWS